MSLFPSPDLFSSARLPSDLPHYTFDDHSSSLYLKSTDRNQEENAELIETPLNTIREFEDVDENAPTLRSEPMIMCINCYECIMVEEIDSHSLLCIVPDYDQEKMREKLIKMLQHIRELKLESDEKTDFALIQLEEICKSMMETTTVTSI
jgi:hypothetical protein